MKWLALLLMVCVLALSPTPAHAADPVSILIAGDSITHSSDGMHSWRYYLDKSLTVPHDFVGPRTAPFEGAYADPNFDQDHMARWGMNMWEVLDSDPNGFGQWSPNIGDMVTQYQPDVVVEQLGVNDLLWDDNLTPEGMVSRVREFVTQVQTAKPDTDIVLGQLSPNWNAEFQAFNALLPAVADMSSPTSTVVVTVQPQHVQDVDTRDGLHPSQSGELKISNSVLGGLSALGYSVTAPVAAPLPVLTVKVNHNTAVLKWTGTAHAVWIRHNGRWTHQPVTGQRVKVKMVSGRYRFKVEGITFSNTVKA